MAKPKSYHESFARFFENPTRDGFRDLLKHNVGELRACDFKAEWPEQSGLARHILGLGNSGGGCLVIGVEEQSDKSLSPTGLSTLKDKADITNGIKNYLPTELLGLVDVADFSFDASEYPKLVGKKYQVLFVDYSPTHLPFVALRAGSNIRANAIYVRREGVTEEATHTELQKLINTRVETGYSTRPEIDLKTHLEQLRILLTSIPQYRDKLSAFGGLLGQVVRNAFGEPNPDYPKEDFDKFVLRMIELKKKRIADELDVSRLERLRQ